MKRLSIEDVKQGMVIAETLRSPLDESKILIKQGTRLTEDMIDRLERMKFKALDIMDPHTLMVRPDENMKKLIDDLYDSAFRRVSPDYIQGRMNDNMVEADKMARRTAGKLMKDDKVLEICVSMQIVNFEYLLRAGVITSVYSMLVAYAMGLDDKEIYNIGYAALIADIGLAEMSLLIDQDMDKMAKPMQDLYKEHATYGYYMMSENNVPREVVELIYCHHEKYDGSGYPRGLKGEEIPVGSRIINLCSDYYRSVGLKKVSHYEAIEYIYGYSGTGYDKWVVKAFTENIPIYPLGAIVKLTTQEIGIVVNVRKNKGPRPVVCVHFNRFMKPLSEPKMVDLSRDKTTFITDIINY